MEKINIYINEPHQRTGLNGVSDIIITINNKDQFIHPSNSFFILKGEIIVKDGGKNYNKGETGISFIRNGLIYLFFRS